MPAGVLIVFEGAEGAGKTTQIDMLAGRLRAEGVTTTTLREPGGTPVGDSIRELLLEPGRQIVPEAEALLFMASRAQIVKSEIDPALARGVVVLVDRFFLSTYAYQIDGRGLDEDLVRSANRLATGDLVPDLTIVLAIAATEGLARASKRGGHDRIEQTEQGFHLRVEKAFDRFLDSDWQAAHPECGPIVRVDGRGSQRDVHARVVDTLARKLPDRFSGLMNTAHTDA